MASEQAAVGSEISVPTVAPAVPTVSPNESDVIRTKSLKRGRPDQSQNLTNIPLIASANQLGSRSPKSPRYKGVFSPGFSAMALTGAAALADQRRLESPRLQTVGTSENPGHKALSSLMAGGGTGMSKPQDAPNAVTTMSEGLSIAASAISIPTSKQTDEKSNSSPASVTSLASLGSTAPTVTANSTAVASPANLTSAIEAEGRESRQRVAGHHQSLSEDQSSKRPMTFPGNLLGDPDASRALARGSSLPMPGQNHQLAPRSPSQKKHKCPYCETEFTRHHNLKSHLLTHSQEKPYSCQTCNMRFRRLHDLKRHMKLHTGERPHICPKCDRKFARGDALARHSKGQGGCAGRRSSMGSFGGDDDFEGSNAGDDHGAMDGVMYTNGTTQLNENETSEERRFSLPAIQAQHVSGPRESFGAQSRAPSTYPPAMGPRPGQPSGSPRGLYPPGGSSQSSATSASMQSMPSSIYSQSGLMESPKPLSPAGMSSHQLGHDPPSISRQRSPSLASQLQQQHFGRQQSHPSSHGNANPPKLPALSSLAPPEQRFTLSSSQTTGQQNSIGGSQQVQNVSGVTSPTNNLFAAGERGVFAYVQTLEDKVKKLSEKVQLMENKERNQEDKINRLSEEVYSLRGQLSAGQTTQQPLHGLS